LPQPKRRRKPLSPVRPPFRWLVWTLTLPLAALLVAVLYFRYLSTQPATQPPAIVSDAKNSPGATSAPVTPAKKAAATRGTRKQNSSAIDGSSHGKRIALILDDAGFSDEPLHELARLEVPLSFAILPNAPNAKRIAELANDRGFEVLCHLPLEPMGTAVSPGKGAITTSMGDAEIFELATRSIRSIPHAVGVNNHMGSRATADRRTMGQVLAAVRETGTYFVDSRTTASSVGAAMAQELNVRTASRDVFLDDDDSIESVRRQLRLLVTVAEKRGSAIGIGHLYPSTIRVLREELPAIRKRGFEFVLASELVK